jgi:hypothetical protein
MPAAPATKLIIGEGAADEAFFRALIKVRGIDGYDVFDRQETKKGDEGGSGYFKRTLESEKVRTDVPIDMRKLVILVADNDEAPAKSFKDVRGQVRAVEGLGIPSAPLRVVKPREVSKAYPLPCVVVVMLPGASKNGSLESLCYESARAKRPIQAACVEKLTKCLGADKWETTKRDKLRLGCLLGGLCKRNPDVTLRRAWSKESRGPADMIPLDHACFDWIETKLRLWAKQY